MRFLRERLTKEEWELLENSDDGLLLFMEKEALRHDNTPFLPDDRNIAELVRDAREPLA
jgi:hypothetical protein